MKRLLLVVLLTLTAATLSFADLSIVWDQTFEDIESGSSLDLVPLANGEFMHFFAIGNSPTQIHAMRFDSEGLILGDSVIATTTLTFFGFDACPTIDGGVIASVQPAYFVLELFRWDRSGELIQSEAMTSDQLDVGHVICQNPDGSLILGGWMPDLLCVDPQFNIRWYREYQEPTDFTRSIVRLISGVYLSEIQVNEGSWWEYHVLKFTPDGTLRGSFDFNYNDSDPTPCPFDNTVIYTTNATSDSYPSRVFKYNHWTRNLPNDVSIRERYVTVEPFNGVPGYLCAGYEFENAGHGNGLFVEVSEAGVVSDPIELADSRFHHAKPKMNGEMMVVGKTMSTDRMRLVCVTTGIEHTPVSGQLWLHDAPRRLSSDGGGLHYRLLIGNNLDEPADVTLQLVLKHIDYPEQVAYETVITLQPHEPVVIPHDQLAIPGGYPAGEYELTLRLYDENDVLCSSSMQLFTKAEAGFGNTLVDDEPVDPAQDYALAQVYPNPFNAATTITVTLPRAAELTMRVFDIQGRTVATLAAGSQVAAGSHSFSFDGSNLASGIYFVQASVPGQLNEVRKLMLVK